MMPPIDQVLERLSLAQNGDRPAALRELGDCLASLDVADWVDRRRQLLDQGDLRAVDLDGLRADGLKRADETRRVHGALAAAERNESTAGPAYFVQQGAAGTPMLYWRKPTPDGHVPVKIADFVPRVVGERVRHKADGTTARVITCEVRTARGVRALEALPEDLADSRRFYAACVHTVGADARLANAAAMKHLPMATLELADPERVRSEVYEFSGWQEADGQLIYLAAGGAIGTTESITVDLAGLAMGTGVPALAGFGPRDDGDEAMATALAALTGPVRQCFPDLVTLPGLAAVFLAPLLHWAPTMDRPALHYIGTSGVRKSALLALLQAFYGLCEAALSWRGTANSIEIALSALRDALVTVDDLKVATSDRDAGVKIIQSYADRRGRSRATRTGELARARFVGGLLVSAGEDVPSGEASVAARTLFVPIGATDSDLEALSKAQAAAPQLATLTARYVAWLIGRQSELAALLAERFTAARGHYRRLLAGRKGLNDAGRVAVNCALLDVATAVACDWLVTVGWTTAEASGWLNATRGTLEYLAHQQAEAIGAESAAGAFLGGLRALLDGRRVELVEVELKMPLPALAGCSAVAIGSTMIGWRQGEVILLQPELALAEVRRWLSGQGRQLPTDRGLYAQLRDGGFLAETGDRTTVVRWIAGRSQRVLALRSDALSEPVDSAEEDPGF